MHSGGKNYFSGKTVLVVILGIYGGGAATAKWLLKHGAKVTVTDMRTTKQLARSLKKFTAAERRKIRFVLGGQHESDFRAHDIIVVGPGVPRDSKYLLAAKRAKRRIENDASLFFRYVSSPVIGVTGTRGKTTTTAWIAALLKKRYGKLTPTGNNPDHPFFAELDRKRRKGSPIVAELSSWQLEYLPQSGKSPHVALITNMHPDHLNRYRGMEDYAEAKSRIFAHQTPNDVLILNYDNPWHAYFAKKKRKSVLYYISRRELPKRMDGLFVRNGMIVLRRGPRETPLFSSVRFLKERGGHNLENLLFAILAVLLFDPKVKVTERAALALPSPRMRQEVTHERGDLTIVNDSCATSPDGTIAAIKRFSTPGNPTEKLILIAGGTDKTLEFAELAKVIKKHILPEHLILLEGSATTKLQRKLRECGIANGEYGLHSTLKKCVTHAFSIVKGLEGKTTILFSPGAASFEKFLNEFDRGEAFNRLVFAQMKKHPTRHSVNS